MFENRLKFFLYLLPIAFSLIGARLFYLQVAQGDRLRRIAESNRTTILFERAPRGMILDRNGVVLADNKPSFAVLFIPMELKEEDFQNVVERLAKILQVNTSELHQKLFSTFKQQAMMRLLDRASRSIAFALAEARPNLPGISVITEMQRRYPLGTFASHLLGYLGQVSEDEFQKLREVGYRADWLVGKVGLEKTYDAILRGQHGGTRIEVDARGHSLKILDRKPPVSGEHIRTTLDFRIQQAAEEAFRDSGKSGAAVAVDPRNGEILAFVSSPSFDPNLFLYTRGEEGPEGTPNEILSHPALPLFNRATQATYPPGSVFKIVATMAALESKNFKPENQFTCPGYFWLGSQFGGKKFLCWKKTGHGRLNLQQALVQSCNVYYYQLGLKIGPDPMENFAKQLGLGKPVGIDFAYEKSGLVPGRTMFKKETRRWFEGDTLNMAIGQGTMLVTPVQAALLAAAVANHGKVYKPQIVKEVQLYTGEIYARSKPHLVKEINLSDATWEFLDETLTQVVERGTGQPAKISGIRIAGKTGTAQNPHGKDHAWFVAYAPVGNPTIALSVLVEHGEKGSVSAAPIARKMLLAALGEIAAKETGKDKKEKIANDDLGD